MKQSSPWFALALLFFGSLGGAFSQGTAFTYQGRLTDNGSPANGNYDLRFRLSTDGGTLTVVPGAPVLTRAPVGVTNGYCQVPLDFGAVFDGAPRWLEIAVRTNGIVADYTVLRPFQSLTPSPYAAFAGRAGGVANGAVIPASLGTPYGPLSGQSLSYDGSQLVWSTPGAWDLLGNSGTGANNFLGTRDNQPLELKVNNSRVLRLEPNATGPNLLAGHPENVIGAGVHAATIGGGGLSGLPNVNNGHAGTIGGGVLNTVLAIYGTVAGGFGNSIDGNAATVGGGSGNRANGISATVAGGSQNLSSGDAATIGGGNGNVSSGNSSTAGGGYGNTNSSDYSAVGGGYENEILKQGNDNSSIKSTIGGGGRNRIISGGCSTIGGGCSNDILDAGYSETIAGGSRNSIGSFSQSSTIGGGEENVIQSFDIIYGSAFCTIAGGAINSIREDPLSPGVSKSSIGGGLNNLVQSESSTIAGGWSNEILSDAGAATIGGGIANVIQNNSGCSTIAGGCFNSIFPSSYISTNGGGYGNSVLPFADDSVIAGGYSNRISGAYATVPGGTLNLAAGDYSFSAGRRAKANHDGAYVWADSFDADFASSAANEFAIRAHGGVRLSEDTPSLNFGQRTRQMLNLWGSEYGIGVQTDTTYFRSHNYFAWFKDGVHNDAAINPGVGGVELMHLTGGGLYVNGTFVSTSDRNAKQDFAAVDTRAVLEKVAQLPLATWTYKNDAATKHLGPVAQDFYAAFQVGPDDKHIATVDADGVALAAIQGLNQKVDSENAALHEELRRH